MTNTDTAFEDVVMPACMNSPPLSLSDERFETKVHLLVGTLSITT